HPTAWERRRVAELTSSGGNGRRFQSLTPWPSGWPQSFLHVASAYTAGEIRHLQNRQTTHSWLASLRSREEISRRFPSCVPPFHSARASGAGRRYQRHSRRAGTRQVGDYKSLGGNYSERN